MRIETIHNIPHIAHYDLPILLNPELFYLLGEGQPAKNMRPVVGEQKKLSFSSLSLFLVHEITRTLIYFAIYLQATRFDHVSRDTGKESSAHWANVSVHCLLQFQILCIILYFNYWIIIDVWFSRNFLKGPNSGCELHMIQAAVYVPISLSKLCIAKSAGHIWPTWLPWMPGPSLTWRRSDAYPVLGHVHMHSIWGATDIKPCARTPTCPQVPPTISCHLNVLSNPRQQVC